jgi:hypothetical protein
MVAGEDPDQAKVAETVFDHSASGFGCQASSPQGRTEVKSKLVHRLIFQLRGAKSRTADVLLILKEKEGPILDAGFSFLVDFVI